MRFEYECEPYVSPMEMPYSNRCNNRSTNAEPDIAHDSFNMSCIIGRGSLADAEYDYTMNPDTITSTTSVEALHESMLIHMGQSGASTFSAASLTSKQGAVPCFTTSTETSAAPPGMWTSCAPRPIWSQQVQSQITKASSSSSSEGWISNMVKSVGGSLGVSHDAECMEQLLVHCMTAIESNDATLAQQLMWVLNNTVSTDGDPNQRVAAYFLRALISRAAKSMSSPAAYPLHARDSFINSTRILSAIELAGFVDLTPWHRFGFSASNGAIMEALEGWHSVHIVDFSITHCMQWPTLIEALSKRAAHAGPPPHVRLTVHSARPHVPPLLNMSFEEVGLKLATFARSKNVPFKFNVLPKKIHELTPSCIEVQEGEMLVINCQMRARYISDEVMGDGSGSARLQFMRWIRAVHPNMLTFVDEDADMGSNDAVSRLKEAFNYLWIPYDAMDTFLPRESMQRIQYEGDIGSKIENIIACEGEERVERLENKERWMHRLRSTSNLQSIQFSEAVVAEVKSMLEEHAAGWSLKKDGDSLLLTWKGHNVVFATACVSITTS